MENTIKLFSIIGILAITSSFVYFFAYRPYHKEAITKQCHKWVSDQTKDRFGQIDEEDYDMKFKQCLNEYGQ